MESNKDDMQSVLHSLSTLMFINIIMAHSMECKSVSFITSHITYLRALSNSFSNSFIDFYSRKLFHTVCLGPVTKLTFCGTPSYGQPLTMATLILHPLYFGPTKAQSVLFLFKEPVQYSHLLYG